LVADMDVAMANGNTQDYRVLDGMFHQAMFDLAENQFLSETFTVIAFRIQALRNRLSLNPALNEKSHGEHKRLLELVTKNDNEKVVELLAWHMEWTRSSYIELLGMPAADDRPTRERRLKAGKR
ncbi:FCD domain-containing protein, partial [Phyllobacterium sp. P5_D12]